MSGVRNLLDFVSRWAIIGLAVAFVVTQARSFLEGPDEAAIVSVPGTESEGAKGEGVNGMREGLNRLASTPPGTLMKIRVWRQGKRFAVTTTVEERPSPSG